MPDLEPSIAAWRKTMMAAPHVGPDTLDELETHLRETVEELVRSGVPETEAFERAVQRLGSPAAVTSEFQKLNAFTWLPATAVTAAGIAAALLLAGYLFSLFQTPARDILLAAHVLAITLGYGATLLLGVLGVCFVCQRCATDFSPRRVRSLSRVTSTYGQIAALLTALGMVLGMVWSHQHWGRYWGWDSREVGALSVVVWLLCFLCAHRSRRITARGALIASLLGSNLVLLAWFGPLFPWREGLHSYGMPIQATPLMLAALAMNLLFFLVGLAPAGWLRLRKA